MPQNLGLYRDLTVTENLRFVAGATAARCPTLPDELAAYVDVLVADMPLGTQREVAFLAALPHSPGAAAARRAHLRGRRAARRGAVGHHPRSRPTQGVGVLVTTHNMQEAEQCDRLLLMSGGRLVAQGSAADIIGDTTAIEVRTDDWAAAFAALDAAGAPVILDGRSVRVADTDPGELDALLEAAGIVARLEPVPATIEERMLMLAWAGR